jgi:hypothetical protein
MGASVEAILRKLCGGRGRGVKLLLAHNLMVDGRSLRGAHKERTMGTKAASFGEDQLLSFKKESEEGYH